MFPVLVVALAMFYAGCQNAGDTAALQARVDSLQRELSKTYKPGLGEFMSGIQVHHAKLWFAGQGKNWKLADFEMGEIREAVEDIQHYCTDRPEIKSLPMLAPTLDTMDKAIKQQDEQAFTSAFATLTNTCNGCHHATSHEFNVIKVPDTPPFSNQVFAAP